jgi:hypothetical protein
MVPYWAAAVAWPEFFTSGNAMPREPDGVRVRMTSASVAVEPDIGHHAVHPGDAQGLSGIVTASRRFFSLLRHPQR